MADNITAPATGEVFATDDIGGVQYPRTKITLGGDGVNGGDVSGTNPLPVLASLPDAPLTSYGPVAGVIAINTILMVIDLLNHRGVSVHVVAIGSSGVITPEWSNNNVDWFTATMESPAGALVTTMGAPQIVVAPAMARYLRLRLSTATTAGTTTLAVHRFNDRPQHWLATQPVSGTVTSTVGTSITGGTISPLTVAGVSVEASSARTATGNSAAAITNASGSGALFFVNVTAATGTSPTLVVRLQAQDPVGLGWVDIPAAATATITAAGLTMLTVAPGIAAVANSAVNFPLPRTFRLAWVIGGTTPSFTFSVGMAPVI